MKKIPDVKDLFKRGTRVETSLFKMYLHERGEGRGAFAVIVGKRYGNAVKRNRIKRVFREILREQFKENRKERNLILLPRERSKKTSSLQLKERVSEVLENLSRNVGVR